MVSPMILSRTSYLKAKNSTVRSYLTAFSSSTKNALSNISTGTQATCSLPISKTLSKNSFKYDYLTTSPASNHAGEVVYSTLQGTYKRNVPLQQILNFSVQNVQLLQVWAFFKIVTNK